MLDNFTSARTSGCGPTRIWMSCQSCHHTSWILLEYHSRCHFEKDDLVNHSQYYKIFCHVKPTCHLVICSKSGHSFHWVIIEICIKSWQWKYILACCYWYWCRFFIEMIFPFQWVMTNITDMCMFCIPGEQRVNQSCDKSVYNVVNHWLPWMSWHHRKPITGMKGKIKELSIWKLMKQSSHGIQISFQLADNNQYTEWSEVSTEIHSQQTSGKTQALIAKSMTKWFQCLN